MELTLNIKEKNKITPFLNLIKEMDYIEIINIIDETDLPNEHKVLLDKRLKKIENGEISFKSWELIKQKYEETAI